jgi:uncharacterized protein GlcG (DUF336 family)
MQRSLCVLWLSVVLSTTVQAEDLITQTPGLAPAGAFKLAHAALDACRARDLQVSVAVVDRAGDVQVLLRDQLAPNVSVEIAERKARTAAAFRRPTLELADAIKTTPALANLAGIDRLLFLGGGVPVEAAGSVIAAIGVSGAPSAQADHDCATQALATLADDLML